MSSKEYVKSFFGEQVGEWAANYADLEARSTGVRTLVSRHRFAQRMVEAGDVQSSKVLDVGCGTGEMAARLIEDGHDVWGLDIAEQMVRYARQRCASDQFRVGDIERIPFEDNTFDAVVCLGVIEYLDTDEQALREMRRVLKPGGRAVISAPNAISALYHIDGLVFRMMQALRPAVHLVKYRVRGKRPPSVHAVIQRPLVRRHYRRKWLKLLRSVGFEPEELVCYGWGWYTSWPLGLVCQFLAERLERSGHALERVFGRAAIARASDRIARGQAIGFAGYEQLVRARAVK